MVVASCSKCNREKGTRTAEEFGHPFVAGREYSIGEAVYALVYDPALRQRFSNAYQGLPQELASIDEVSALLPVSTASSRRPNGVFTASTNRSNAIRTQEPEQEQNRSRKKTLRPAHDAPAPVVLIPTCKKNVEYKVDRTENRGVAGSIPGSEDAERTTENPSVVH